MGRSVHKLLTFCLNVFDNCKLFFYKIIVVYEPYKENSVPEIFLDNICSLPNGIELFSDDYFLVGCEDGIYRVNFETKSVLKVVDITNAISLVDGMYFDSQQEVLYVVQQEDHILAVSSNDNWETVDILYVFIAGCPGARPSTVTLVDQTLFANCLGSAVYDVRYMKAVNDAITDGNSIYGTDSVSDNDDESDRDDNLIKKLRIAVIVLGAFCGVLIILVAASSNAMNNMHKARTERLIAEQRGDKAMNPMAEVPGTPGL